MVGRELAICRLLFLYLLSLPRTLFLPLSARTAFFLSSLPTNPLLSSPSPFRSPSPSPLYNTTCFFVRFEHYCFVNSLLRFVFHVWFRSNELFCFFQSRGVRKKFRTNSEPNRNRFGTVSNPLITQ